MLEIGVWLPLRNDPRFTLVDRDTYQQLKTPVRGSLPALRLYKRGGDEVGYVGFSVRIGPNRYTTRHVHRIAIGAQPGQIVDHINGDTLDNRRRNLRMCTIEQNVWHRRVNPVAGKRYVGYYKAKKHPLGKPWKGLICKQGKDYHLGYFATEEEAARAYNVAASKLFGEFAPRRNAV